MVMHQRSELIVAMLTLQWISGKCRTFNNDFKKRYYQTYVSKDLHLSAMKQRWNHTKNAAKPYYNEITQNTAIQNVNK